MHLILRPAYALLRLYWWLAHPVTFGVRMLLVKDGQVLLVRHTYQPGWQFPGGSVKHGETLEQGAVREAYEESGVQLSGPPRFLGVFTNFSEGKTDHVALFCAEELTIGPAPDRWEIESSQFFPLDQLPDTLGKAYRRRIDEYVRGSAPQAGAW